MQSKNTGTINGQTFENDESIAELTYLNQVFIDSVSFLLLF